MNLRGARVAVAFAAVLVTAAGGSLPVRGAAAACGSTQSAGGRWTAVDVPATPSLPAVGATPVVTSTVVGQDPSVVLATDGIGVFRSTDGGCSWRSAYTVGAADYWSGGGLAVAYSITDIVNGHSAAPVSRQDVYLVLSPNWLNPLSEGTTLGFALPEIIVASHDGGATFANVPPAPTVASPLVPECLSPPSTVIVPATDSRTLYLQCTGGLAQGLVGSSLVGSTNYLYRSVDGGASWSLLALPGAAFGLSQSLVAGRAARELWFIGVWYATTSDGSYLAIWHSTDGGARWAMSIPEDRPGWANGQTGIAVDTTPGHRAERVVAYAATGAYLSTDTGRHWTRLPGVASSGGQMFPAVAFFVRDTPYVVAASAAIGCADSGTVFVRYTTSGRTAKSVRFPSRWGRYDGWGYGGSLAVLNGPAPLASGLATFCPARSGQAAPPRLLTFRAG